MFFYHMEGIEEVFSSGMSFFNKLEADKIQEIIEELFVAGIDTNNIGIITPYSG